MKPQRLRQFLKLGSLLLCVSTAAALLYSSLGFLHQRRLQTEEAKRQVRERCWDIALQIDRELGLIGPLAEAQAAHLEDGSVDRREIADRLRDLLTINPEYLGVGVAFTPFSYDPESRLFALFHVWTGNGVEAVRVDEKIDYTLPEVCWYHSALPADDSAPGASGDGACGPRKGGATWNEPRFDETIARGRVTEYSAPVFFEDPETGDRRPQAVIVIQYDLEKLHGLLAEASLGENGYAFIVSPEGSFISHPTQGLHADGTVWEMAAELSDPVLAEIGKNARDLGQGLFDHRDFFDGSPAWIYQAPVSSTGWSVVAVLPERDVRLADPQLRRQLMNLLLLALAFLLTLSWLLMVHGRGDLDRHLLAGISFASLVFMAGIAGIWYLAWSIPVHRGISAEDQRMIYSHAQLRQFRNRYLETSVEANRDIPLFVPTGLFIQSVELPSESSIRLTGYVWMQYTAGLHDRLTPAREPPGSLANLSPAVIFPQAVTSDLTPAYIHREGEVTIYGWFFETELRTGSDLSLYPLDTKRISIRLWHRDFDRHVVLVPDLDAYSRLQPAALLGFEQGFSLPGWTLETTYFAYSRHRFNTDFGIGHNVSRDQYPELHFWVTLRRSFVGPYISNVLPLLVVALILFIVVASSTRGDRKSLVGLSAARVLSIKAALFFAVLLGQLRLRQLLGGPGGLVYLEYFYFALYLLLMVSAVNGVAFFWGVDRLGVQYRDNLLYKASYWPVLLSFLLILTVYTFY